MNIDNTYISPLGFAMTEEEMDLRRKQLDEVAKQLLFFKEDNNGNNKNVIESISEDTGKT